MLIEKIKAIIYQYLNITSLYVAVAVFSAAIIVDFIDRGDKNG